ncbi:eukaryotic translation initiation factor gamma [Grosmannia clavigera kw1407]|uniref:tRNA (adenine(58)-N(1))-methyltransferase non-catalytic subunit TRM6 n=1 Tax=Grosmannia clavigera (strain kw1407 / UAMH 11150) TaxID=655863 RepID=F0X772_GROCL|nr:eukaryotic translation initiation factor gamma [Grosmannia clavigera kw1407]EFX06208.1 eukaryotic translation initiation factor gamma [Grosmannia clavigera kw1407]
MSSVVQPHGWVGLKLPSEHVRFLEVIPNTTISLGKYGSFPSNLIIERPFHLTYELEDRLPDEDFCRLRVISPAELHADSIADEAKASAGEKGTGGDDDGVELPVLSGQDGVEYSLIDMESQAVIARSNRDAIDASARQALTTEEIEELKREGTGAGKDLIAKLLLSHAALDQKTTFSLAKYKLLKAKKYIRRFTVVPLDVCSLGNWLLDDKDVGTKILGLRDEMTALLGCWANVHYGGPDRYLAEGEAQAEGEQAEEEQAGGQAEEDQKRRPARRTADMASQLAGGRWLAVDDTGGLLVAAMAERMGILHKGEGVEGDGFESMDVDERMDEGVGSQTEDQTIQPPIQPIQPTRSPKHGRDDLKASFSLTNTLTLLHANSQPNLAYLRYFGFDHADPHHGPHPLADHLLCLSWLQLLDPASDTLYASPAPVATAAELAAWKPGRRGNYYRKRRRWARTRHAVEATRAGGFAGLVVATTMDLISTLRHTLPLLAGGAPVAVYSPTLEPLAALADCFSVGRRAAWMAGGVGGVGGVEAADADAPETDAGDDLERWPGTTAFPLNPMLLLGTTVQTSRARRWQVLPGRTHPLMTARGGSEGYIFTGWKALPAEGRVTARGRFKRRKTADGDSGSVDTPPACN